MGELPSFFADPEKFKEAMEKTAKMMEALEPLFTILETLPPMKVVKDLRVTTTSDGKKETKTYGLAILIAPREEAKPQ